MSCQCALPLDGLIWSHRKSHIPVLSSSATSSAFYFFWVDISKACISCGTISVLSSGPKLHLHLEWLWKNDINDNMCGLVVWYIGTMSGTGFMQIQFKIIVYEEHT